eukprot:CAMPEP_0118882432 /NCGR_PEP_ID=MMETSP1163-20130328/21686_1 /TAXON_ID=124430 /ORGANISM="Phaeomonas parva, Strain CCMP2877" /LENGTH=143 /DNA_ID=CAMNT_0006819493 /DNA_START=188 /DNA_END=616 /DNA_ORIENTATION=+
MGVAYPTLMTAKAAKQRDEEAYFVWLTYWIVWAGLAVLEYSFMEWSLAATLPLYYEGKVFFILWLVLPRFQGAALLFDRLVLPALLRYEEDIDARISDVGKEVRHRASEAATVLAARAGEYLATQTKGGALLLLGSSSSSSSS